MKRHGLDLVSLIAGLVFAVVAGAHLAAEASDTGVDLTWLFPLVLVGLGVAGLAGSVRGARDAGTAYTGDTGDTADTADRTS